MKLLKLKLPRESVMLSAAATKLMGALQYGLWIAAPAGQFVIAVAMVCRRTHREFPSFFAYTIFHVLQAIAGLVIRGHSYSQYFYFYWICEGIDAALSLAIIQEVFLRVFRQYGALERLGQVLFRWALIVLFAIAIVSAASASGNDSSRVIAGLMVLERSVGFINCGLLFFLFFLSRYFGLHWRHLVFGIAFGMGTMAAILTVTSALQAQFQANQFVSSLVPPLAFNIAVGIWVYYALAPEVRLERNAVLPEVEELQRWNDLLARMLIR